MMTTYVFLALALIWAILRFRRRLANQSVFKRVKQDQFIVGNGYMKARYDESEIFQFLFGSRFEYVNPMDVTMDIKKNGRVDKYYEKGKPIKKEVGFFDIQEWEETK